MLTRTFRPKKQSSAYRQEEAGDTGDAGDAGEAGAAGEAAGRRDGGTCSCDYISSEAVFKGVKGIR